jgi:hypothetical protein
MVVRLRIASTYVIIVLKIRYRAVLAGDPCLKMESLHFEGHGSSRIPYPSPVY